MRVPPAGTWERRRADLWHDAERWLGPPGDATAEGGRELLVRRHLAAFGPAARADVATWAGLTAGALAPALETMDPRRFRAQDGTELIDLPDGALPVPDTPAPVRFLPTWDATLLTHVRRTGILPEEHRARIFSSRNPRSYPVFLVDGVVAGTWRYEGGGISTQPFGTLTAAARREVAAEAKRLAAFHA